MINLPFPTDPPPCPAVLCEKGCPNGYKDDENGCQTCECKGKQRPKHRYPFCRMSTLDLELLIIKMVQLCADHGASLYTMALNDYNQPAMQAYY